jgi:hypothetical protein
MAYVYYTNTTLTTGVVKLTDIITGRTGNSTNWNKLVNPGAITYHYEGWLFVNTLPSAKKAIFWKDTNGVALCLDNSTLTVDTVTQVTAGTNSGPNAFGPPPLVTVTEKFPQQKWVYFVVNVINQNVVEVYLNGKLIQTKQLASPNKVPNNTRGTLYLGGTATVDGYVTKFKRDPVALLPDEVWKNYLAGNGLATFTNWLAGYNASFSVHSGTEEIMKKSLFT